jgi:mannosyltransferase
VRHIPGQAVILSPARTPMILGSMIVVSAALRLHSLGAQSLGIDEAASVRFATMPFWDFLATLWHYQGNMTLYYFLLRAWTHLGDSEFALRSPSVLFGVLTVLAIYVLAARLFGRTTGLIAAALLSVHSFHIDWSREARSYSLLVLLLVLTMYLLVSAMESQRKRDWTVFTVSAALCLYAHIFAALVLIAFAIAIAFARPFQVGRRTIVFVAVLFEHLVAPMALFVLLHHSDQIDWIQKPTLGEFSGFLDLLTGQGGTVLVVVYLTLCAFAFASPGTRSDKESWALRLLGLWLVLPPLLTLAASPIKPLFAPHLMVMCVPALIILAARGITNLSIAPGAKRLAGTAACVLVITLSLVSIVKPVQYEYAPHADWRSAVDYVLEHQRPGDGAVFYIPNAYPYLYYVRRAEDQHRVTRAPDILYPPAQWQPLSQEEVSQITSGRERVWLVLHIESLHPEKLAIIESTLNEKFRLVEKHVFRGEESITVDLYDRT